MYTEINREICKHLREDLDRALRDFGKDRGIEVKVGNATFNDQSVTFKLTLQIAGHNPLAADFERYAEMYGLKTTDLGRSFYYGTKIYTVSGLAARARKAPILCSHGGKEYKFEAEVVASTLRQSETGTPTFDAKAYRDMIGAKKAFLYTPR